MATCSEPMDRFIGVKVIQAEPAPCPAGGMGKYQEGDDGYRVVYEDGYRVVYEDGYESWSPKAVFDEAYRKTDGMSFGLAIEAMKKGYRVCRVGWNGKNMFVYFVEGATVPLEKLRGNCAKAVEASINTAPVQDICGHIDMMAADGAIVVGWLASQTDMLADDWMILA